MQKYLTPEGFKKLKKELDYLKNVKRKEIAQRLERCISFGDLTENSEFQEAKDAQAFLEGRILELEDLIQHTILVSGERQKGSAQIGSVIVLSAGWRKEKFKIVGAEEADPLEGKISIDSPLGRTILNQPEGAEIIVDTPQGKIQYKIIKIE